MAFTTMKYDWIQSFWMIEYHDTSTNENLSTAYGGVNSKWIVGVIVLLSRVKWCNVEYVKVTHIPYVAFM